MNLKHFENTYTCENREDEVLAVTCIDGYPEDENAEGRVVAQVVLTAHGDIAVVWNDNSYRCNEEVLALIEESKKNLHASYRKFRINMNDWGEGGTEENNFIVVSSLTNEKVEKLIKFADELLVEYLSNEDVQRLLFLAVEEGYKFLPTTFFEEVANSAEWGHNVEAIIEIATLLAKELGETLEFIFVEHFFAEEEIDIDC